MSELVLYADSSWASPWAFHAIVVLQEMGLPYKLLPISTSPIPPEIKAELRRHSVIGKVPCLVDGDFWLTESATISEYLAERFPPPAHPRIIPEDIRTRARCRQVMSAMRTSMMGLRDDRSTASVFMKPEPKPFSERGQRDATELLRLADAWIAPGKTTLFDHWTPADADFTLMLMRMVANGDPVPDKVLAYTQAQWARPSVRHYMSLIPTTT